MVKIHEAEEDISVFVVVVVVVVEEIITNVKSTPNNLIVTQYH